VLSAQALVLGPVLVPEPGLELVPVPEPGRHTPLPSQPITLLPLNYI